MIKKTSWKFCGVCNTLTQSIYTNEYGPWERYCVTCRGDNVSPYSRGGSYGYIADKDGNIIAPSDFGWGEEE